MFSILSGAERVHAMQRLAVEKTRLRIPLLFGFDVIHGHRTIFPIPLGEAALFDPGLWEASAREAAKEAAADGIHLTFAPMLDVTRDPRWGRIAEGPGEDAFVAQVMARAKVAGFQGANLANAASLAACAKHYCAYGAVTAGRDYASTEFSDRSLSEIYLAAVSGGGGGRRGDYHARFYRRRRRADERASRASDRLPAGSSWDSKAW